MSFLKIDDKGAAHAEGAAASDIINEHDIEKGGEQPEEEKDSISKPGALSLLVVLYIT